MTYPRIKRLSPHVTPVGQSFFFVVVEILAFAASLKISALFTLSLYY